MAAFKSKIPYQGARRQTRVWALGRMTLAGLVPLAQCARLSAMQVTGLRGAWAEDEERGSHVGEAEPSRECEVREARNQKRECSEGEYEKETVGFGQRGIVIWAGDLGLTSALYELGRLAKGTLPSLSLHFATLKNGAVIICTPILQKACGRIKRRHEGSIRQTTLTHSSAKPVGSTNWIEERTKQKP